MAEAKHSWESLSSSFVQAKLGDDRRKEEVFAFLRARFLTLARYRVQQGAEDVVQETLAVVHSHFSELDSLQKVLGFANGVLRNKLGNLYQKRDRHKNIWVGLDDVNEPSYRIEAEVEAGELERIVGESITRLGEKSSKCQAILLRLCQGLDPEEISALLGIPKSTLKIRTFRCRQALKTILVDEYGLNL